MFQKDAAVHHHEYSRLTRFLRCLLVHNLLLHPHGWHLELDSLVDDFLIRPAEDVDDVDLFRHVEQRRVGFFAQ